MKKKKAHNLLTLLFSFFIFSATYGQEFGNFNNIENLFSLSKKQIDSTLSKNGYSFKLKDLKSGVLTYSRTSLQFGDTYNVLMSFKKEKLNSFSWEDNFRRASFIVADIGNNEYKIDETKTNDILGIYYLKSSLKDLDIIIFKTASNIQKDKISFRLFKRTDM